MVVFGSSSITLPPEGADAPDQGPVVWLRGEHDVSTVAALSETLARAAALGDAAVVIDLSEVEFMDAATVATVVRVRTDLRAQDRSLVLRSPSRSATRIFDLCGLSDLFDEPTDTPSGAGALESWVAVPRRNPRLATPASSASPSVAVVDSGEASEVPAVRPAEFRRSTEVGGREAP